MHLCTSSKQVLKNLDEWKTIQRHYWCVIKTWTIWAQKKNTATSKIMQYVFFSCSLKITLICFLVYQWDTPGVGTGLQSCPKQLASLLEDVCSEFISIAPQTTNTESCQQNNPLAFPFIDLSSNGKGCCQTTLETQNTACPPCPHSHLSFHKLFFSFKEKKKWGLLLIISFPWRCIVREQDAPK